MNAKEKVIEIVRALPDDALIEEVLGRLLTVAKFEYGIEQADEWEPTELGLKSRLEKQKELRNLWGKIKWEGDLDAMRRDF